MGPKLINDIFEISQFPNPMNSSHKDWVTSSLVPKWHTLTRLGVCSLAILACLNSIKLCPEQLMAHFFLSQYSKIYNKIFSIPSYLLCNFTSAKNSLRGIRISKQLYEWFNDKFDALKEQKFFLKNWMMLLL